MKLRGDVAVAFIAFIGALLVVTIIYYNHTPKNYALDKLVEKSRIGELDRDYTKEVVVKSVDDLSFSQDDKNIKVNYGGITFKVDKEQVDRNVIDKLAVIGIKIYYKKDGSIILKYRDEFMKEVVK